MKHKTLRITEKDFLLANRRASRNEEIEKFGKQVLMRTLTHKSKKVYDRNRLKRAAIKNDDSSFYFIFSHERLRQQCPIFIMCEV
jgi:hypothetical protein